MTPAPRRSAARAPRFRCPGTRLLGAALLGTALLAAPPATARTAATAPAQVLFDSVNQAVQENYGGLSTVDRAALRAEYQTRLDAVCAPEPQTCASAKAYPVVQAEITALGDEHSFFQTPEDFRDFVASATGGNRKQFGVKLARLDGENRVVLEVVPDSAAAEAGLRRGDLLETIGGLPYTYERLRAARLGDQATALGVDRQGQRLNLSITPRESSTRDLPRLTYAGPQGKVAVLRIPTFLTADSSLPGVRNLVAQTVHNLVGQAQARGATGMIVDLRGNGGGNLSDCDGAVSAFVPSFVRVARTSAGDAQTRVARGLRLEDGEVRGSVSNPRLWTGPLAVLVDKGSASCSEFFAYEIQYAGRGPVIGEATAGVGNTATRVFRLPDDAALQLTITHYVKSDGAPYPTQVTPDQAVAQTEAVVRRLTQGVDVLLDSGLRALGAAPALSSDRAR
ncbi:S41 family peptidase [Deinococcus petrolearius]|uniref:S41 family peptidase n=1 Tax=Deinococcus petrolearius TaxID=1751295 RepID=A0ABW1DIZ9_9DEIO